MLQALTKPLTSLIVKVNIKALRKCAHVIYRDFFCLKNGKKKLQKIFDIFDTIYVLEQK